MVGVDGVMTVVVRIDPAGHLPVNVRVDRRKGMDGHLVHEMIGVAAASLLGLVSRRTYGDGSRADEEVLAHVVDQARIAAAGGVSLIGVD